MQILVKVRTFVGELQCVALSSLAIVRLSVRVHACVRACVCAWAHVRMRMLGSSQTFVF